MDTEGRHQHRDDRAVSPVVGTIMTVAIAVVLAAPVYSWVTGARSEREEPATALAVTSDGPIASDTKGYVVASATPGLRWTELTILLDGTPLAYDGALASDGTYCIASPGMTCAAGASPPERLVGAGDALRIHGADLAGRSLLAVDAQANSALVALTVR